MGTQAEWNKKWMIKQRKMGLCIFCKSKRFGESALCEKHFFLATASSSLKDRNKGEELQQMFHAQDQKCYLSGRKLIAGRNASIDHINSVSKHPELRDKIENLRWCDKQVNKAKDDMTYGEFVNLCKEVVNYSNHKQLIKKTSLLSIKPTSFGKGSEKTSSEIDEYLYGWKKT